MTKVQTGVPGKNHPDHKSQTRLKSTRRCPNRPFTNPPITLQLSNKNNT